MTRRTPAYAAVRGLEGSRDRTARPRRRPVADTHAHLDMLEDPALALARAALAGVSFVATVADPTEDAWRTFDELPAWLAGARDLLSRGGTAPGEPPEVRVILGAHPHNAQGLRRPRPRPSSLRLAADSRIVRDRRDRPRLPLRPLAARRAARAFRRQLELARELGLPAVVHLREAHDDGARDPARGRPARRRLRPALLHRRRRARSRASSSWAARVSFAGPVTFKKADAIREAAVSCPSRCSSPRPTARSWRPSPSAAGRTSPRSRCSPRRASPRRAARRRASSRAAAYANALRLLDTREDA